MVALHIFGQGCAKIKKKKKKTSAVASSSQLGTKDDCDTKSENGVNEYSK